MPITHSPLRYPGGKSQLSPLLKRIIKTNHLEGGVYAEPFAGGCGLALDLLFSGSMFEIWINDLDPAIYAFWKSVLDHPTRLCDLVESTEVTIDQWHKQKIIFDDGPSNDIVDFGFSALFLNRTNRSGILQGGVIGGKEQAGKYKLDCRFNKNDICRKIRLISSYKSAIKLYNLDAKECLDLWDNTLPKNSLINIDPPYFKQGSALYLNHYNENDHSELSKTIKSLCHHWLLTYDDVPEIEALYTDLPQYRNVLLYSAQVKRRSSELFYLAPSLIPPAFESETTLNAA